MIKKILHLCHDGNFIENSISVFEHFYSSKNVWFILERGNKRIVKSEGDNIHRISLSPSISTIYDINKLCRNEGVDIIVLHGLYNGYIDILNVIYKAGYHKVYWICWGFELYKALGSSGKMRLIDDDSFLNPMSYFRPTKCSKFLLGDILHIKDFSKVLERSLPFIDYFCFWLYEDYLLLKKYYSVPIGYKLFQYNASYKNIGKKRTISDSFFKKEPFTIMINHQASSTGNHHTIMKKLKHFEGIEDYKIMVPLSYGSRAELKYVRWIGKRFFKEKFVPIDHYMDISSYNAIIGKMEVAIFGQLRQEAGGNIYFLLSNGCKVFMREDNILYQHYKKQGYFIFTVEHDLNSVTDLKGLTIEEKWHNAKVAASVSRCYEDFMPQLFD